MATLSKDKKYVTVVKGDNLSSIYSKYKSYTSATSYQQLGQWNGIKDLNLIYLGQKIYFSKTGATTAAAKKTASSNCVTNVYLALNANSTKELLLMWSWHLESKTASYEITWQYRLLNNKVLTKEATTTVNENARAESRYTTFTIPDNAKWVQVRIKPIAKKKKNSKGEDTKTPEFSADWTKWFEYTVGDALPTPNAPSVELKGLTLTATLEYTGSTYATKAQFQIYKNGNTSVAKSKELAINKETKKVSWPYSVPAGNKYMVRVKVIGDGVDSAWSSFSEEKNALPTPPSGAPKVVEYKPEGATTNKHSVQVSWSKVNSATGYKIQYIDDKNLIDQPDRATEVTVSPVSDENPTPPTSWVISDIDGGKEWFFRVCATNEEGSSKWSAITSITLGTRPGVPTTWESTTKATVGDIIRLYWIHNSLDGSTQAYCNFSITIDGAVVNVGTDIKNLPDTNTDELSVIHQYPSLGDPYFKVCRVYDRVTKATQLYAEFDTDKYFDPTDFDGHAVFKWQVQTAGITKDYSNYSTEREIDIYAKPQLELTVTDDFEIDEEGNVELGEGLMDELTSFPFYVKALATPEDQTPIGYHLSVVALDTYETVDQIGNSQTIRAGDEVYSQNFDISTMLLVPMSASNIDLENGIRYMVRCAVYMNSGLSAEAEHEFYVSWTEERYAPNVEYSLDTETFSLSIHPYCEDSIVSFKPVTKSSKQYVVDTDATDLYIETLDGIYLDGSGELVRLGLNARGNEIYYCIDENSHYINVTYSNGKYVKTTTKLNPPDIQDRVTTTGEEVLLGTLNGETLYYSQVITKILADGVTLSVYRREFDGSFIEIESGIDNSRDTFVIDPHPALDYGRYRIVATDIATGAISYYDPPGFLINGKAVIIQWDEEWSSFDGWSEDPTVEPPWTGSLLKLPYNIDVTDTTSPEVTHVKYAGRKHPVSYHGTHLGETATWNVTVPKEDTETLYQLRRLKVWMGNVYVREPSGTGYWATLTVSDPRKHNDVLVQVSLNITRVEGGI